MKKILVSLVLSLIVGLFITNISYAQTGGTNVRYSTSASQSSTGSSATAASNGCQSGWAFNPQTGARCAHPQDGCQPGYKYSPVTGAVCSDAEEGPVPVPPVICIEPLTRGTRGSAVVELQQKLQERGYYSGRIDGTYGTMTSAAVTRYNKAFPCPPTPKSSTVVISGVKGPQTLAVGQKGTWTVSAYDKSGGDLSYSVRWGDEAIMPQRFDGYAGVSALAWKQTAAFSHSYSKAGVYYPVFRVQNENGDIEETSLSVKIGEADSIVEFDYFSVGEHKYQFDLSSSTKFDNVVIQPDCSDSKDIYIFSSLLGKQTCRSFSAALRPTYGISHTLTLYSTDGDTHYMTIRAQVYYMNELIGTQKLEVKVRPVASNIPSVTVISPNGGETWAVNSKQKITWRDESYPKPICAAGVPCPAIVAATYDISWLGDEGSYGIAQNVYGSSYIWTVDKPVWEDGRSVKIKICRAGTSLCDTSNGYFRISSVTAGPIKVTSPNGGVYHMDEPLKVSWTPYKGEFDHYYVMFGNKQSGVSVNVTPDKHISKYATSYSITNLEDLVDQILVNTPGRTAEDIRESYYVEVSPGKFNSSGDTLESLSYAGARSKLFTVLPAEVGSNITVVAPNGGETWVRGSNRIISWSPRLAVSSEKPVDIILEGTEFCREDICTTGFSLYTLARSAYGSYYNGNNGWSWEVGETLDGGTVPDGSYRIRICQTGTNVCDSGDGYFRIATYTTYDEVLGAETFVFTQKLMRGSQGLEVAELQKYLQKAGHYTGTIDGRFGASTQSALIGFQTANGLKADGIAGAEVRAVLNQ